MSTPWHTLPLNERLKVAVAMLLVKMGKLKYDQFTETELNQLIIRYFPHAMALPVPVGKGTLNILNGEISMPTTTNRLQLSLFCSLEIRVLANPIYRAHIIVTVSAAPYYSTTDKRLTIESIRVDNIHLVQDEYALLTDTSKILDSLSPIQVSGLLGTPMKTALNFLTAGRSTGAVQYLQLYIGGSKQRILDYHRDEIEDHIINAVSDADVHLKMDPSDWRQNLFSRLGKHVSVEDKELRFYF